MWRTVPVCLIYSESVLKLVKVGLNRVQYTWLNYAAERDRSCCYKLVYLVREQGWWRLLQARGLLGILERGGANHLKKELRLGEGLGGQSRAKHPPKVITNYKGNNLTLFSSCTV